MYFHFIYNWCCFIQYLTGLLVKLSCASIIESRVSDVLLSLQPFCLHYAVNVSLIFSTHEVICSDNLWIAVVIDFVDMLVLISKMHP